MLTEKRVEELEKFATDIRIQTIRQMKTRGFGHMGGAMSICDLLSVLYGEQMKYDADNPEWEERDWLICSKGHAGPAVYAALALKGFFPMDWLDTLNQPGTRLPSHCDHSKTPGIDVTTGSLGQGLSVAAGIAFAKKIEQKENTIFDAFMADSEVELDDDAIDEALDRQMSYMANQMMAQGIQLDQYLQMTGMDEEKLREQMKPSATQQAKLEALIDEIIAVENIVVTEEVLDEQLNMVGQANQMTKEQVLEKIDLEGFKRDLSRMQASRIIVNNAVEK